MLGTFLEEECNLSLLRHEISSLQQLSSVTDRLYFKRGHSLTYSPQVGMECPLTSDQASCNTGAGDSASVPQHQRLRRPWRSVVPDTVFQLRLPSQPVTVPSHAVCILLYLIPFAGYLLKRSVQTGNSKEDIPRRGVSNQDKQKGHSLAHS